MDLSRTIPARRPAALLATLATLALLAALSGCGGSSGGGTTPASGPRVTRLAAAPEGFDGSAEGYDATGAPVYAVQASAQEWTVYASKDRPLYSMAIAGVTSSKPEGIAGKYVVGDYSGAGGQGTVAASLDPNGSVSTSTFAGYGYVACASGRALVTNPGGSSAGYSLIDLATGSVTSAAIPADARPFAFRGDFVLCGGPSPAVFDAATGASVALRPAAGTDGTVLALAVNARGQALGATASGGIRQLRLWDATGAPGGVLDATTADETLAFGCLSLDGTRMAYKKAGPGYERQFIRSGGVSYLMTPGSPYATLRDMDDAGTTAFAADLSADEARVTVSIAYP